MYFFPGGVNDGLRQVEQLDGGRTLESFLLTNEFHLLGWGNFGGSLLECRRLVGVIHRHARILKAVVRADNGTVGSGDGPLAVFLLLDAVGIYAPGLFPFFSCAHGLGWFGWTLL